jgi:hypothetical protein
MEDHLDAPWLEEPELWHITEVAAGTVRPGWYLYVVSSQRFLAVAAVSTIGRGEERRVYLDLGDGRTVVTGPESVVTVRRLPG